MACKYSLEYGLDYIGNAHPTITPRIFDNLTILSTIKFMAREPKPLQKKAMLFWFLGLVTSLADVIRQYVLNILKIQKLV